MKFFEISDNKKMGKKIEKKNSWIMWIHKCNIYIKANEIKTLGHKKPQDHNKTIEGPNKSSKVR
jgi:hypothetical protein